MGKPGDTFSSQAGSKLPTALLLVLVAHQLNKGVHLSRVGPHDSGPQSSSHHFPGQCPFSGAPSRDPCLIAFPSFLPDYLWVFLTVLVIQTISANFQLVFNENCSMFRCILDVYVAGDKFHILLLHHPDQSSYYSLLIRIVKVKLILYFAC